MDLSFDFDSSRPIYLQLAEAVEKSIASGVYAPGGKLPSVREFALQFQVNPNTMQKALQELERKNLIYTRRASGRFVTEDASQIQKQKRAQAQELTRQYLQDLQQLGFEWQDILTILEDAKNENC